MSALPRHFPFAATVLVFFHSVAAARGIRIWTFADLVSNSDAIAIVIAISKEPLPSKRVIESVESGREIVTFSVVAILKGESLQQLRMVNYLKIKGGFEDDHDLVEFEVQKVAGESVKDVEAVDQQKRAVSKQYLIFLKVNPDGTYRPTTGYLDAGQACRLLEPVQR